MASWEYFPNGTVANLTSLQGCLDDDGFIIPESMTSVNWTLDCMCNATFTADPDIGGVGVKHVVCSSRSNANLGKVITAFFATCAITTVVAAVADLTPPEGIEPLFRNWFCGEDPEKLNAQSSRLHKFCALMLGPLADLQTITGIGILVAAYLQLNTITSYHFALVDTYWWLTMNSMFAAARYMEDETAPLVSRMRITVGTIAKMVSVGLGIGFEIIGQRRGDPLWSSFHSGKCYLWKTLLSVNTPASDRFWIATLVFIWIVMMISLFDTADGLRAELYESWIKGERRLICECRGLWNSIQRSRPATRTQTLVKSTILVLQVSAITASLISRQFLGFWGLCSCAPGVAVFFYFYFLLDNSYFAIKTKILNYRLLEGSETAWGFGQVLPMILMAAVVFNALDAVAESRKRTPPASKPTSLSPRPSSQQPIAQSTAIQLTNFSQQSSSMSNHLTPTAAQSSGGQQGRSQHFNASAPSTGSTVRKLAREWTL